MFDVSGSDSRLFYLDFRVNIGFVGLWAHALVGLPSQCLSLLPFRHLEAGLEKSPRYIAARLQGCVHGVQCYPSGNKCILRKYSDFDFREVENCSSVWLICASLPGLSFVFHALQQPDLYHESLETSTSRSTVVHEGWIHGVLA